MKLPKLYKKDSKGKLRLWFVEVHGNVVLVNHGLVDGKLQTKKTVCKAKNVGKRSSNLFKYKEFFDTEALIIDVWKDKNENAMLTVKLKNDIILELTPKRTHEERKQMLSNKDNIIGKWIRVKYQAETDDGNNSLLV